MESLLIVILGIVPPALMFLFGAQRKVENDLNPLTVLGWALVLGYTLKSLYLAVAIQTGAPFRTMELSREIIPLGQVAICVGLVAFLIGFLFVYRGKDAVVLDPPPIRRVDRTPEVLYYGLFGLSFLLMLGYFYQMGFARQLLTLQFQAQKWFVDEEGVRSTLGFLTIGGDFLLVFFLFYVSIAKKFNWLSIYVAAISFSSLCYILASRRNGVLLIIVGFLMVGGLKAVRATRARRLGAVAAIVIATLLLSLASEVRKGGGAKELGQLSISEAVSVSAEHIFEGAYFLDPAKTAAVVEQTSKRDLFLEGSSFLAPVFAPIPRILWSEKPDIRIGPYVGQTVLLFESESGAPPGGIGELYLNFGWAGILVGMLLLGAVTGLLYNRYLRTCDKRFSRPLYALMLLSLMLFLISDFSFAILYVLRYSLAAFVCMSFWRKVVAIHYLRNRSMLETRSVRQTLSSGLIVATRR